MTNNAAKATIEELRQSALNHYEEASKSINCWNSFVYKAIMNYNPPHEPKILECPDCGCQECVCG